jgi:enoyl-CoA hydratase/carnithine racemase
MIHHETTNGVHRIEIRRPEKKNALTADMYSALAAAFEHAATHDDVRVVLLLGAPGVFCSGNDLADFLARPPSGMDAPVFQFLRRLITFEKPVVAAVAGMAVGIGTTMLLHCDHVVASEDAQFSTPFANIGLCPEAGSSLMLPLAIGTKRAAEMLLFGDRVSAAAMHGWGLVNAVVPNDRLVELASSRAAALAVKPPASLRASKKLLRRTLVPAALEAMEVEAKEFGALLQGPAAKECLSAFLEKRAPDPAKF